MKKIKLTIVTFMVIIFLSSCGVSKNDTETQNVQKSWQTHEKWLETESISTWFTNK